MEHTRPGAGEVTAVILAAGANTRLEGILPPGLKPLIPVNGKTLYKHAVDHANDVWDAKEVILVASPDNVRPLAQLGHADHIVIQPAPDGVVDAIRRAIRLVRTTGTLILCADNTFDLDSMAKAEILEARQNGWAAFGARRLAANEARRFTRFVEMSGHHRIRFLAETEALNVTGDCWIGPMYLPTGGIERGLKDGIIRPVVDLLNTAIANVETVPVSMNCSDLGIPEAL